MQKFICLTVFVVCLAGLALADGDESNKVKGTADKAAGAIGGAAGKAASGVSRAAEKTAARVSNAADKTANRISSVADKTADRVGSAADNISAKVGEFMNPPPHRPSGKNIVISAVSGIGRLAQNLTGHAIRFGGAILSDVRAYGRNTTGAITTTIRDSADRIAYGRYRGQSVNQKPQNEGEAISQGHADTPMQVEEPSAEAGDAPAELNKEPASS